MSDYHVDRSSRPAEMSRGGNARPGPGCRVPTCRGSDWMEKQRQEQGDRTAEWKACKQWLTLRAGLAREEGKEGEEGSQKLVQSVCVCVCVASQRERESEGERDLRVCSHRQSGLCQEVPAGAGFDSAADRHRHTYKHLQLPQKPAIVCGTNKSFTTFIHTSFANNASQARIHTHTHTHTEIQ